MGSVVCEVDSNGQIVFELRFVNGQNLYRAHKFDWFFTFSGCMDTSACNFDSTANTPDTSCLYATFSYDTIVVNGSYFWNGNTLTSSGDYSILLTNSVGCDSTAFLNLFISNSTSIQQNPANSKTVVKIVDVLGRQTNAVKNKLLFYIYNDGSIQKRVILE